MTFIESHPILEGKYFVDFSEQYWKFLIKTFRGDS